MRAFRSLLWISLAVCGCKAAGSDGTSVLVAIDASPPLTDVAKLNVTARAGGQTRTYPVEPPQRSLPPALSITIEVPSSVTGTFQVEVQALDSASTLLATAIGQVELAVGTVRDLRLTLVGSGAPDMSTADLTASADLTTVDLLGADLVALPDLTVVDLTPPPDMAACNLGAGPPYSLVGSGIALVEELLVDTDYVYWSSDDLAGIQRTLKAGCSAVENVTTFPSPVSWAMDATNIYFATGGGLYKCAKSGCGTSPTELASGEYYYMTLYNGVIYAFSNNDRILRSCATTGCGGNPTAISAAITRPNRLVATSTSIFMISGATGGTTTDGAILKCPLAGCGVANADLTTMTGSLITPTDIVASATNIYYTTYNGHTVESCAIGGCAIPTAKVLESSLNWGPTRLAIDGSFAYITNQPNGTVLKCALTGCGTTPTSLGGSETQAYGIGVDASGVYWARREATGRIRVYK
jgi:hypothetical protein